MLKRICDRCGSDLGMVDPQRAAEPHANTVPVVIGGERLEVCKECGGAIVKFIKTPPANHVAT